MICNSQQTLVPEERTQVDASLVSIRLVLVRLKRLIELRIVVGRGRESVERPSLPGAAGVVDEDLEDSDLQDFDLDDVDLVDENVDSLRPYPVVARGPISDSRKRSSISGTRSRVDIGVRRGARVRCSGGAEIISGIVRGIAGRRVAAGRHVAGGRGEVRRRGGGRNRRRVRRGRVILPRHCVKGASSASLDEAKREDRGQEKGDERELHSESQTKNER